MRLPLVCVGLLLCPVSLARQGATTTLVSLGGGATPGNADSSLGQLAADGTVAFHSYATSFGAVPGGGVFARDAANTSTSQLSVTGGVTPFAAPQFSHDISRDGRFCVLESSDPSIVPGDTNGASDVFLLDRNTGTWQRVSVSSAGVEGNAASTLSIGGSVAEGGRFVAFISVASNFAAGDVLNTRDAFVHDTQTGVTECVSMLPSGVPAGASDEVAISADGRMVAFVSSANGIVVDDLNNSRNLFVRDRQLGVTRLIDRTMAGTPATGFSQRPALSGDGRFVAFTSASSQLVPGDVGAMLDVFCADLVTNTIERVSVSSSGVGGNQYSLADTGGLISFNGRFIAFSSGATNLVSGDTNGVQDAFLRDRWLGTTQRVSLTSLGAQAMHLSYADSVSDDGRRVAFSGSGDSFTPGDTNGFDDIFVRWLGDSTPQPFCTAGTSANGCVAQITANVSPNTNSTAGCVVSVSGVDGGRSGLIFYGVDNGNFVPPPWNGGSSFRCVRAPVQRTGTQSSGGTIGACDGTLALNWDLFHQTHPGALGAPWMPGMSACVQAWIRDPPSPGSTSLSDAVVLQVVP